MSTGRIVTLPTMQPTQPHIPQLNQDLRRLRQKAGLSQTALAQLLGVHQTTVSVVERGGPTSTEVVDGWARVCNGRITVVETGADPWNGVPESLRSAAVEVAHLWCRAEESTRNAILLMLRGLNRQA